MLAELAMRWSTDEQLVDKLDEPTSGLKSSSMTRSSGLRPARSITAPSRSTASSRNHAQLFLKKSSHPPIVFVKLQKANARY